MKIPVQWVLDGRDFSRRFCITRSGSGKARPTSARLPTRFALRPLRGSPHSRTLPLTVTVLSRLSGCDNVLPTRVALSLEASHERLLVPRSQLE